MALDIGPVGIGPAWRHGAMQGWDIVLDIDALRLTEADYPGYLLVNVAEAQLAKAVYEFLDWLDRDEYDAFFEFRTALEQANIERPTTAT